MQISKVCLMVCLAGVAAWQLQAQPAGPELQAQAVDLLRQTISQERQHPVEHPVEVVTRTGQPAPSDQQDQALQLLRQKIQEEQATAPQVAPTPAKTPTPAKSAKSSSSGQASSGAKPKTTAQPSQPSPSVPATAMNPPSPFPGSDTGLSATKQQRLMDLLQQYKADKISPADYQVQRAKILAEP